MPNHQPFVQTTLAEAQQAMPFPVILPPTDVFPLRHIMTKRGGEHPFGPEVRITLGDLFSGAGFWIWQSASGKRFGPNSQAVEIAGYPASVMQSVTNVGVPFVIASAILAKPPIPYSGPTSSSRTRSRCWRSFWPKQDGETHVLVVRMICGVHEQVLGASTHQALRGEMDVK